MAVGFLGFMTEGILTSITFRHLEGNERVSKIWQHLSWQIVSLICIIAGFLTIFQNKVSIWPFQLMRLSDIFRQGESFGMLIILQHGSTDCGERG